jgi:hypothetical protein
VRGRLAPLVRLAAVLTDVPPSRETTGVGVAVGLRGHCVVVEVDEVIDLVTLADETLPRGWSAGWATTAVRRPTGLVPVLDVGWLADLLDQGVETTA